MIRLDCAGLEDWIILSDLDIAKLKQGDEASLTFKGLSLRIALDIPDAPELGVWLGRDGTFLVALTTEIIDRLRAGEGVRVYLGLHVLTFGGGFATDAEILRRYGHDPAVAIEPVLEGPQ